MPFLKKTQKKTEKDCPNSNKDCVKSKISKIIEKLDEVSKEAKQLKVAEN